MERALNSIYSKTLAGIFALLLVVVVPVRAEDGYRLWLRYDPIPKASMDSYHPHISSLIVPGGSATLRALRDELKTGCTGLLGTEVPITNRIADGAVIVGTPSSSTAIAGLGLHKRLHELGPEGFLIQSVSIGGHHVIAIASVNEIGALYGAFHFLRLIQT